MHGKNPVAKFIPAEYMQPVMKLQVREIFLTLQGEGPFSGRRAVFLRLTGCPLRCQYCDTAWDDKRDKSMHVHDIVDEVKRLWGSSDGSWPLVVITGGEPLRQPIDYFCSVLHTQTYATIQIETAGVYWRRCLDYDYIHTVVSPKTPKLDETLWGRAEIFKYVIDARDEFDPKDGIPITATQPNTKPAKLAAPWRHVLKSNIYLSPCDTGDPAQNKLNLDAVVQRALQFNYRAGIQFHKLVGLP